MSKILSPRDYFSDSEEAIDHCCRGCKRETGWLDEPEELNTPECAIQIIRNMRGSIVIGHDGVSCRIREKEYQRVHQAELELYEKRMRGDWS